MLSRVTQVLRDKLGPVGLEVLGEPVAWLAVVLVLTTAVAEVWRVTFTPKPAQAAAQQAPPECRDICTPGCR